MPEVKKAIVSAGLIGRVSAHDVISPGGFFHGEKGALASTKTLDRLTDGLNWYFGIVRAAAPERWDAGREGRLCNNFGVPGFIRLLGELIRHIERRDNIWACELTLKALRENLQPLLEPVLIFLSSANEEGIERLFNVKLGSGGARQYYFALSQIINASIEEFQPAGFKEWKSDITNEEQEKADKDARWIQDKVHGFVVEKLREAYGEKFFDVGISSKEIKLKAHDKRMSESSPDEMGGPERYLDFLDLRKIVEQKENWPYFEASLSIPLPQQKKGMTKYIQWFDEINRIRRISAHPYQRAYSQADLDVLKLVTQKLSVALAPAVQGGLEAA